ncbi:MAG TPA: FkbM family methyltransferase [Acidimicrobiales bacterium]|nr:FkbM family methyltransferase [Acidimicrobiales bacterium]
MKPGDTFVDVGANVGTYTLWAADLGARAIAVEPDPTARALLCENLALNGYDIEVLPVALADAQGTMRLTSGLDGANHLLVRGKAGVETQEVQVDTLDNVIGDRTIAGVKIDVEGAEALVLSGAQQALASQRIRCLQLEWNEMSRVVRGHSRQELAQTLKSFGYRLYRPDSSGELRALDDPEDEGPDVFARPAP